MEELKIYNFVLLSILDYYIFNELGYKKTVEEQKDKLYQRWRKRIDTIRYFETVRGTNIRACFSEILVSLKNQNTGISRGDPGNKINPEQSGHRTLG